MSTSSGQSRLSLGCAYGIEGINSISSNLLLNGVAFYMAQRFGWSATENLLLAMGMGAFYAVGSLTAGWVTRLKGKSAGLIATQLLLLCVVLLLQGASATSLVVSLLLAFSFSSALAWPILESTVTEGCDAHRMSRRVTLYNLTWSTTAMVTIAVYGTILARWPAGALVLPLILHVLSLVLAFILHQNWRHHQPAAGHAVVHAEAEPELLHHRRLALWLARICMPASFVVTNCLMALFASLPASVEMGVQMATLIASLWMVGRFLAFVILGLGHWWHTRPWLLLAAGSAMLLAFLLIVIPAERVGLFNHWPLVSVVALIAAAEMVLGLAAGMVYSGSLYFGMVLSKGSTDHGGYHEALIGVGSVAGPGLAAAAQVMGGGSHWPGIAAVSGLMVLTLLVAGGAAARLKPEP